MLSAAHCLISKGASPKIIRLGEQNLRSTDDDSKVKDYKIVQSIRHPLYRGQSKYNDIALFQLDRNVIISDYIRPACLWQNSDSKYTR